MSDAALTGASRAAQTPTPMRKVRLSKMLGLAVLVPLFLAAVLPESIRTLVCRYSGVVMPEESCCPVQAARDLSTHAQLLDESCCVVKTVRLVKLVSDRQTQAVGPDHHEVGTAVAPVASALAAGRPPNVPRPAVLGNGPPIVLLKHAFLI
jgi:hypothetical protein